MHVCMCVCQFGGSGDRSDRVRAQITATASVDGSLTCSSRSQNPPVLLLLIAVIVCCEDAMLRLLLLQSAQLQRQADEAEVTI